MTPLKNPPKKLRTALIPRVEIEHGQRVNKEKKNTDSKLMMMKMMAGGEWFKVKKAF